MCVCACETKIVFKKNETQPSPNPLATINKLDDTGENFTQIKHYACIITQIVCNLIDFANMQGKRIAQEKTFPTNKFLTDTIIVVSSHFIPSRRKTT